MLFKPFFFLFILVMMLLVIPITSSVQTVKTVEYPIAYVKQPSTDTNYQKSITIQSPDGIQDIISLEVYMKGDFQASTNVKGRIKHPNGTLMDCDPVNWTIPSQGVVDYDVIFDCTNLVNDFNFKGGTIEAGFRLDKTAQNVYTKMIITYLNNPPSSVASIGGTEYSTSEAARVVLQILDNQGNPINDGNCYTTIRDSDDNVKANNQSLSYITSSSGLYYYQFMTTLPIGVYSTDSYCIVGETKIYSADTFHVAQWIDEIKSSVSVSGRTMQFFGTEYNGGDSGTVWLQLLENQYQPINDGRCYITAYNPDKSIFLNNVEMTYLSASDGIYYYDLTVPNTTGVYILSATCYIPENVFYDTFSDTSKIESSENVTISGGNVKISSFPNVFLYPYGWWHLNENSGTNAYDSSGNGRNGTTVGSPSWVKGKLNNSLYFTGTQYVDIGSSNCGFEYNQSFSAEAWFNLTSSAQRTIVSKAQLDGTVTGWDLDVYTLKVYMTLRGSGSYMVQVHTNNAFSLNTWYHVVMTYNGSGKASGIHIYLNGVDQFLVYDYDNLQNKTILNDKRCFIGAGDGSTSKYWYWYGQLDEVVIYNKTLSQDEVTFRYNSSYGTELMGYPENATIGYVRSIPITLNDTNWETFNSSYTLNGGTINFKVLDNSNNEICSDLGNISACANTTSPIKLYAQLIVSPSNSSPEIDDWEVAWNTLFGWAEIKGSGEIHVSPGVSINSSEILSAIYGINNSITGSIISVNDNLLSINQTLDNKLSSIRNDLLASIDDVITLVEEHNNTLLNVNQSLSSQISNINVTTAITDASIWNYTNRSLTYYPTINASVVEWLQNISEIQTVANAMASFYDLKYAGGTEYKTNEEGLVAYQFLHTESAVPSPVNTASCNVSIWYPNQTIWIDSQLMTYLTGSYGMYYYNITTPTISGVYTANVVCLNDTVYSYGTSSFHVAPWTEEIYTINPNIVSVNDTVKSLNVTFNDTTIMNKLYSMQDELASVNDTVKSANASTISLLLDVTNDLIDVSDLITNHNTTVLNKLYAIQDELISINDTVKSGFTNTGSRFDAIDIALTNLNNAISNMYSGLNTTITNWGNYFDSWFNTMEGKLDNINATIINSSINVTQQIPRNVLIVWKDYGGESNLWGILK